METKKHTLAKKKLNTAVATFVTASGEVDKAITLIDQSITEDRDKIRLYEDQIKSIEQAIDQVQADVISKTAEKKSYEELSNRLIQFTTVGGE